MAVNSGEECQSVQSAVVFPDRDNEVPSNMSSQEVPKLTKTQMCSSSDSLRFHTPFILDADIEKGRAEKLPKIDEECVANQKSDDSFARALLQEICLQMGGKIMQLLMNHGTELPKFISRDKFDTLTPTNRSRKYKRSASFNSRRVVLLFSVLSSMGTIILIYLTLRVRQISDGYDNL